jgi:Ni/Co efflux regulator RcnB
MKIFNAKNIGGTLLGLLMLLGTVMMSSTTTQAQYPWPNQDQYRRQRERERQLEAQRQAELQRQAEIQRQRNDQYNNGQWNNGQWNNGQYNNGQYNNGQWNRSNGRRGRNGDNYGNYGGSYELRQTALNAGYNEGNKAGRNDRRSGRYNPEGSSAYRNAMKDYNSRMGDRYAYQQYFRSAFINGYSDGYNGY